MSYLSEKTKKIFDDYKETLKTKKAKSEYFYVINSFCDYAEKDYLDCGYTDFKAFCDMLDTSVASGRYSFKTICFKHSVLHMFSTYIDAYSDTYEISNFRNYMIKIPKPVASVAVKPTSIPTPKELDTIYEAAKDDPLMYAVVALVNKCALTTAQLSALRKSNIIIDANQHVGMVFPYEFGSNRYLKITDDVVEILNRYMATRNDSSDYFFVGKGGKPLSHRSLQGRTARLMEKAFGEGGKAFTLQDLRNLSVVLMLKGGANEETVANYIGIGAKWIQRYGRAVEEFDNAPCDYINMSVAAM